VSERKAPVGLDELIAAARQRLACKELSSCLEQLGHRPQTATYFAQRALDLAAQVEALAWHGVHLKGAFGEHPWGESLIFDELHELLDQLGYQGKEDATEYLLRCAVWKAFVEVREAAERIDYFLATLERGGAGAQLARDCRRDLDLLPVLSDWCVENDLPAAAAEARHLHGLALSLR
jgi:hypothetical protein